ncbi:MAG: succinate dehydrogenase cytochrome b subunit [Bowdeniella nasicola]|nr:succinate dehydrogenase cytochrome b subunit [Bowdeniella nasicola]
MHQRSGSDAVEFGRISTPAPHHYRFGNWALAWMAAMSGILLTVFVAIHMFGNLKAFSGPESFNSYATWLRVAGQPLLPPGGLLWAFRIGLLAIAAVHIFATLLITIRAIAHPAQVRTRATLLSRGMWITGMTLLVFVILHILDLTTGTVHHSFVATDAYGNLVASLSRPTFAGCYILAMAALAAHLWHGLQLAVVDLGVRSARWRQFLQVGGYALALVIPLVNMSFPILILTGVIQ